MAWILNDLYKFIITSLSIIPIGFLYHILFIVKIGRKAKDVLFFIISLLSTLFFCFIQYSINQLIFSWWIILSVCFGIYIYVYVFSNINREIIERCTKIFSFIKKKIMLK